MKICKLRIVNYIRYIIYSLSDKILLNMISLPKIKVPKKEEPINQNFSNDVFVVEVDKDEIKFALYAEKDDTKIQNVYNSSIKNKGYNFELALTSDEVVDQVKDEIIKAKQLYPTKSKHLVIGISQRNVISFTTTVRIKRINSESKITQKEIEEFVSKIVNNSKAEILNEVNTNLELLNSDIIFTKVDGYITKQPEGMKGTTLEISIFVNFVNAECLEDLISFGSKVGLDLVTIATGLYAFNKTLETNMDSNYLLIDIDSATTNLGVIFAGELFYATYVSFGYSDLVEFFKGRFGQTENEAEEAINGKVLDANSMASRTQILDYFYELISIKLQNAKKVKVLPENIRIIGKESGSVEKEMLLKNLSSLNFKDEPVATNIDISAFSFYDDTVQELPNHFVKNLALAKFCLKILGNN